MFEFFFLAFVLLDPRDVWYVSTHVYYFVPYIWIILPWILFAKLPFMRILASKRMK